MADDDRYVTELQRPWPTSHEMTEVVEKMTYFLFYEKKIVCCLMAQLHFGL